MQSRRLQSSVSSVLSLPALSSLKDPFTATSVNSSIWVADGAIRESGGHLMLPVSNSYPRIISRLPYRLQNSAAYVQIVTDPDPGNGSRQSMFKLAAADGSDTALVMEKIGAQLAYGYRITGTDHLSYTASWVLPDYRWWQIRESAGVISFEVSSDGISWNSLGTMPTPAWVNQGVKVLLQAGYYGTETVCNASFAHFNILPAVASVQTGVLVNTLPADLTTFTSDAGKAPTRVLLYVQWGGNGDTSFPVTNCNTIHAANAVPVVTWEPWDPTAGVAQPAYTLSNITSGNFDVYITNWARAAQSWGHPFYLRLAHEMNGNWYPWGVGVNGNASGDYTTAWSHVRAVCAAAGLTNAQWLWSPNVAVNLTSLVSLYPGTAQVDLVGMDGYNFGTSIAGQTWQTFSSVFNATTALISQVVAPDKALVIAEMGCSEIGGNKSLWIQDMWTQLATTPAITSLTWFNISKETDWRIESSTSSQAAYLAGVRNILYAGA